MEEIIKAARELGKVLQASEEYRVLKIAQQVADEDPELQKLIGEFNLNRIALNEEMQKSDKDTTKIQNLNQALQKLYTDVMGNNHMMAYNVAKQNLDTIMNQVNGILTMTLQGEDPETVDPATCAGDCSSCAGCH